jgi:TRAP-type C4-dicarboxylate transport system substrate-binding protein
MGINLCKKGKQMNTPIFEQLNADWRDAIKSAEARTRLENKKFETEVLELLKTFKRPTVQVKEMIARLENDN